MILIVEIHILKRVLNVSWVNNNLSIGWMDTMR